MNAEDFARIWDFAERGGYESSYRGESQPIF